MLAVIIILLLTVNLSSDKDLANTLNFGLALTSFVLAIIAIIQAIVSNNAFSGTVAQIEGAAAAIREMVKDIPPKLDAIDKRTKEMAGGGVSPQATPVPQPAPELQNQQILNFVLKVTDEFLKTSSWNGLKLLHVCQLCHQKKITFDLQYLCGLDGHMSYDYAYGYLIASISAQFLTCNIADNKIITVTSMPAFVADRILPAIDGRINFIPAPDKDAFITQLANMNAYVALLEASVKKTPPVAA